MLFIVFLLIAAVMVVLFASTPVKASSVTGKTAGLNPRLMGVLHQLSIRTGQTVNVTSGCRRGRGRSMHNSCRAADIRVTGHSGARLRAIARQLPGVGGIGLYSSGILHVDIRDMRMEWGNSRRAFYAGPRPGSRGGRSVLAYAGHSEQPRWTPPVMRILE